MKGTHEVSLERSVGNGEGMKGTWPMGLQTILINVICYLIKP